MRSAVPLLFSVSLVIPAIASGLALRRVAPRWLLPWMVAVVAWFTATHFLAASGCLAQFHTTPPHFLVYVAGAFTATVALAMSPFGARLAGGVGWAGLIGYQVFRVPVELTLAALARLGGIPPQMTFDGTNFDIVTGVTAPIVAWLAATGRIGRRGIAVWNAVGLALLVNVVTTALLSTPTPIRVFTNHPALILVAQPPWHLLPGWLVPAALFGHLVVFRKLRRMR